MFSARDSHLVLDELGDKLPSAVRHATDLARQDYADFRATFPSWQSRLFERDLANVIHPRIWSHLEDELDVVDGIELVSNEPHRQINLQTPTGRLYAMRVKRHSDNDRISSYATPSDIRFWAGEYVQDAFDGMECVSLAVGYRWLRDTRDIGAAVISYREGKDNVVWAYAIDEGSGGHLEPVTYTPIVPELPQIDLRDGLAQDADSDEQ